LAILETDPINTATSVVSWINPVVFTSQNPAANGFFSVSVSSATLSIASIAGTSTLFGSLLLF
jgi:hypothetical protein